MHTSNLRTCRQSASTYYYFVQRNNDTKLFTKYFSICSFYLNVDMLFNIISFFYSSLSPADSVWLFVSVVVNASIVCLSCKQNALKIMKVVTYNFNTCFNNERHPYTRVLQVYACLTHTRVRNHKYHPCNTVATNDTNHPDVRIQQFIIRLYRVYCSILDTKSYLTTKYILPMALIRNLKLSAATR